MSSDVTETNVSMLVALMWVARHPPAQHQHILPVSKMSHPVQAFSCLPDTGMVRLRRHSRLDLPVVAVGHADNGRLSSFGAT